MQSSGDIDSGRSSCSAGSCVAAPLEGAHINTCDELKNKLLVTCEAAANTKLCVSAHPRSCVGIPKSPNERDPFPLQPAALRRNEFQNLFHTSRQGGLSSAQSTLDIVSSTRIEQAPSGRQNAVSMTNVGVRDTVRGIFKIGRPVQRAASRLYSVGSLRGLDRTCVGPEFIVRASQPVERLDITNPTEEKRVITIVLLTGQRIEVTVEPNNTTARQIFEEIVKKQKYEHNFMLGLAVLVGGDFVFLPDDYKVKKVAPDGWYNKCAKKKDHKDKNTCLRFTAFLRIKFFLPTNISKTIPGGEWRYRVYLQLRRSTVEGQLAPSLQNLILLAGYALHIEFGDFFYREHGSGDYFLLEHYLPEGTFMTDVADIKLRMKRAHESRKGMDREKALVNYIVLAQSYRDYGAHFYSAVWATRDGFCRDVWLSIGPRGITLYSRNTFNSALPNESFNATVTNRVVLQSLAWHNIHTLHYNKKTLYIVPNSRSGLAKSSLKYKIKMEENKSYFTFWLASIHHRLYLKLHAKHDFVDYISDELSYPVSSEGSAECSNYQDSYNMAVRNQHKIKRHPKKRFRMDIFTKSNSQLNKENDTPDTQELLQELISPSCNKCNLNDSMHSILSKPNCSSNECLSSSESCSLPRRQGVKMGTRAFHGVRRAATVAKTDTSLRSDYDMGATQSDSDDLSTVNSMKLLPNRNYNEKHSQYPAVVTAYVVDSPKVYNSFAYNPTSDNTAVNTSLIEKFDSSSCIQGERCFVTAVIKRDVTGALGMQVAEGSDGNVYIKSITPNGPSDLSRQLMPGDQIISVNGHTLLNTQYNNALSMLQAAPQRVELIVLQNVQNSANTSIDKDHVKFSTESKPNITTTRRMTENGSKLSTESIASELNELGHIDQEIINKEALKTINALIQLTKQNVIMRLKEQSNLSAPNKLLLQKCISENRIYDESDTGNYSSQESTPQKKSAHHYDIWRCRNQDRTRRRPLSLHIPAHIELSEKFFDKIENDSHKVAAFEKASMNKVQTSLQNLGEKLIKEEVVGVKNVAIPRNFGLSRKWLGPVKYPVTPLKESVDPVRVAAKIKDHTMKKHFLYGGSSECQLFL